MTCPSTAPDAVHTLGVPSEVDQKSWAVKARPERCRGGARALRSRGRGRSDRRCRAGSQCAARSVSSGLRASGEREAVIDECRLRRCTPLERRPPTATGRRERERQDKACVYTPSSGPGSDSHFWAYMRSGCPRSMLGPRLSQGKVHGVLLPWLWEHDDHDGVVVLPQSLAGKGYGHYLLRPWRA